MNSMILLCAGSGKRVGASINKLLLKYKNKTLFQYTLENILLSKYIHELIIVVKDHEQEIIKNIVSTLNCNIKIKFASGGKTRFESVKNGVNLVDLKADKLLIHDCARPCIDDEIIRLLLSNVNNTDCFGAIPVLPCIDTIKKKQQDFIKKTLNREKLVRAQTPQVFVTKVFKNAISKIKENNDKITDDSSIMEFFGYKIKICQGNEKLFKITTVSDWNRFCKIVDKETFMYRIGQGYDIHKKTFEKPLILGGVRILESEGLDGHSDADVLIHAIIDSLLGAAGLSDIGTFFPNTNDNYKNISSLKLLKKIGEIIKKEEYTIVNIDTTVIAETPKLTKFIPEMKQNISDTLNIKTTQIGIKAKTNEKLDDVGNNKGIVALSTALIARRH